MADRLRVLDTDHLSLLQRRHPRVVARLRSCRPDRLATTVVSVEEQIRGRLAMVARARQADDWITAYAQFTETLTTLSQLPTLAFDRQAAEQYTQLRAAAKNVGTQDLKIAAIVLSVGGVLVTRNRKDFDQIPGLALEDWSQP